MSKKYYLDDDLLYKKIKLTNKQKFLRLFLYFLISLMLGIVYNFVFYKINGSEKEQLLIDKVEQVKLNYVTLEKRLEYNKRILDKINSSDKMYRDILDIDTIDLKFAKGGIDYYENIPDIQNKDIVINVLTRLDELKYKTAQEFNSFNTINEYSDEWQREMAHLPLISPVNISIRRGEGIKFREVHPVLGRPAWHHGQDFSAPLGTPVYATGAGKIVYVGVDRGLGNFIKIDHGYGYQTIYGHLSKFKVKSGEYVKRGDLIALSGNTGYSTGPHLHYEIHLYGKYQNPLHFFSDDMTEDEYIEMINTLNSLFR